MMKLYKLFLILFLCFLPITGWGAIENFLTGYTETDPNGRIALTSTRVTWTALTLNEDASVRKDAAVNYTGDIDIAFDFRIDSSSTNNENWSAGLVDMPVGDAGFVLYLGDADGSKCLVKLYMWDDINGSEETKDTATLNLNTVYYARLRRDDDAGTNGTWYIDVYASDANRIARVSVLLSLSRTINVTGKDDYTSFCALSVGVWGNTNQYTGYIENLDLAYVPAPPYYVSAGTEGSGSGETVTPGAPAGIQDDDILIVVAESSDPTQTISMHADWTEIVNAIGTGNSRIGVWWHRYNSASPPTNYTVTRTGTAADALVAACMAYRGAETSGSPFHVVGTVNGGTDASMEFNTITTTLDNCLVLAVAGAEDDNDVTQLSGWWFAFSEGTGNYETSAGTLDGMISTQYKYYAAAGEISGITVTQSASDDWSTVLLALKTPQGAPPAAPEGQVIWWD